MATKTWTYFPIVGALLQLEKILKNKSWNSVNDKQTRFLDYFYCACRNEAGLMPELTGIADKDVAVVNKFLRDKGFSIQLEEQPGSLYSASILDLLVEWLAVGKPTPVSAKDGLAHDGFLLSTSENLITYHALDIQRDNRSLPMILVSIRTRSNGDKVYMLVNNDPFRKQLLEDDIEWLGQELAYGFGRFVTQSARLSPSLFGSHKADFNEMNIPMINLDREEDISWLKGATTYDDQGGDWYISQALQQTKFRMNEFGARVESAVALGAKRCLAPPKPRLTIDSPFFVWIERGQEISRPLFVGYMDYDSWGKPANLD